MLYEGGGFTKNRRWNYKRGSGSKAWVNAHAFNRYMVNSGRASLIVRGPYSKLLKYSYKLLPGDYIAYEKKRKVVHVSIVTRIDSKGYILVNCHNADRHRVPWDLGWSNKEIKV
ncbi:Putative amidase domain-containing protein [Selenihalanaerobacter shriftii]|uniref:Putative amidase domain-containing protein n=1 Tax=Selenihalanaerobacter shriftii TaxID=142842 RepID=A0A1T4NYB4_9FIRM|nr:Putative amidase domain-containing protein [Selenihalanaerobacter shriftii]